MEQGTLIRCLPDEVVKCHIATQIAWLDIASVRAASKMWKMTLDEAAAAAATENPAVLSTKLLLERINVNPCEHWPRAKFASCVAFGNRIVVVGGQSDQCLALDRVDMYDAESNRWQVLPSLNEPLVDCAVAEVTRDQKQQLVVLGGLYNSSGKEQFWVESAQLLGYGNHTWMDVQPSDLASFVEECSSNFPLLELSLFRAELEKGSSQASLAFVI